MSRMKFKRARRQQGFLSVVAVLLIVVVAFIGLVVTSMVSGLATATNNYAKAENALYAAQAGFEETARLLLTPTLSGSNARITCSAISGNANLTNITFGSATFTATPVSGSPYYANTTLSSALTTSSTTIPVASVSGFAPAGRLMIDREVINYGGISGSSFVGVQRGVNQSY